MVALHGHLAGRTNLAMLDFARTLNTSFKQAAKSLRPRDAIQADRVGPRLFVSSGIAIFN